MRNLVIFVVFELSILIRTENSLFLKSFIMGGTWSWLQKKIMAEEEEKFQFPATLDGFGYDFNSEGQLRHKDTDSEFQFIVKEGDRNYNQQHYDALGQVIEEKVYEMLEKDCKLQRTYLPADVGKEQPRSFVFISGDLYTNTAKLMILVHGNGVVRAGQWARRLIINDSLDSGTQIPYIKWARENGYSVIVANPNLNTVEPKNKRKQPIPIPGNSSPEEHMQTVWRELVQRCAAKHVAIVAHSYGGVSTLELARTYFREFEERVFAIALTDSVHALRQQEVEPEMKEFYRQRVKNWASAYDPLDAPLITTNDDVPTVSAGTDKHEYTSFKAMHSIFKFFTEKYEETLHPKPKEADIPAVKDKEAAEDKLTNQNAEQPLIDLSEPSDKQSDTGMSKTAEHSDSKAGDLVSLGEEAAEVKSEL